MKALKKWVEERNRWQSMFNSTPISIPTTPDECKPIFYHLAGELSPENLTCDGELTTAQVRKRAREIWAVWHDLETIFGREVDEGETWQWRE